MNVKGEVAVIGGGASGLGRGAAQAFVDAGARVAILDLASSDGETAAKELGDNALFAAADVTSEEEVDVAFDKCAERFDVPRIAINCAGVGWAERVVNRQGDPHGLDRFETVIKVNLIGTFNVSRVAASRMSKLAPIGEERGVIVNTASIAAFDGQVGQAAYSASKAGVAGMTLPLARDLAAAQIRVVTIAPGTFDTPMLSMLPDERRQQLADAIPHPNRLGRPEEFSALVKHVVENPMLNGEVIRLDGALRMAPK